MKAARRVFLSALATAPLVPALADAKSAPPPPDADPALEGLLAAARARFGHSLEPGEVEEVAKGIEGLLKSAARLRKYPLANGEEPVSVFEARARHPTPRR